MLKIDKETWDKRGEEALKRAKEVQKTCSKWPLQDGAEFIILWEDMVNNLKKTGADLSAIRIKSASYAYPHERMG